MGPFDINAPLQRVEAVASSAFQPTEKAEVGAASVAATATKVSGSLGGHHGRETPAAESRNPIATGAAEDFDGRRRAIGDRLLQRPANSSTDA